MRIIGLIVAFTGCSGGADCEQVTWFVDSDGDTYGADTPVVGCADDRPADAVDRPGDCADDDPEVSPDATEICNEVDDNCDGRADDLDPDVDTTTQTTFYTDDDGDGFGVDSTAMLACAAPKGTSDAGGDCDDANDAIKPGAPETCYDKVDMDCDGVAPGDDADADSVLACEDCDDGDAKVGYASAWFPDGDGDGYGITAMAVQACDAPKGHVALGEDCDDKILAINPGADEVCDKIDNDCDLLIDDADDVLVGATNWYADTDGDTFGDPATAVAACIPPKNSVTNGADCDDSTAAIGTRTLWYADVDEDTYGDVNGTAESACDQPSGKVANNRDCDDGDETLNPDTVWYADNDDDDYGDAKDTLMQCLQPSGYIADDTDCDDASHLVHPGRFDFDDDVDNDCDDEVDEDVGTETYDSGDIQSMVDSECASCHTSGGTSGGLNMDDAYSSIVEVAASGLGTMSLIEPGDLRNSYIWHKVQGTQGSVGGAGGTMPQGGSLSSTDEDMLETWILEGAIE